MSIRQGIASNGLKIPFNPGGINRHRYRDVFGSRPAYRKNQIINVRLPFHPGGIRDRKNDLMFFKK